MQTSDDGAYRNLYKGGGLAQLRFIYSISMTSKQFIRSPAAILSATYVFLGVTAPFLLPARTSLETRRKQVL